MKFSAVKQGCTPNPPSPSQQEEGSHDKTLCSSVWLNWVGVFPFFLYFFPILSSPPPSPWSASPSFFGLGAFCNTATLVNCSVRCPSLRDSCLYLLYTCFLTCWSGSGRMGHASTCRRRRGWGELSCSKGLSSQVNEKVNQYFSNTATAFVMSNGIYKRGV